MTAFVIVMGMAVVLLAFAVLLVPVANRLNRIIRETRR